MIFFSFVPPSLTARQTYSSSSSLTKLIILNVPLAKRCYFEKGALINMPFLYQEMTDRVPTDYNMREFSLHGPIDVDVEFDNIVMKTPVYIKLDASTTLLLSEGVSSQLKFVTYHPQVLKGHGQSRKTRREGYWQRRKAMKKKSAAKRREQGLVERVSESDKEEEEKERTTEDESTSVAYVRFTSSIRIPPQQCLTAMAVVSSLLKGGQCLVQPVQRNDDADWTVEETLVSPSEKKEVPVLLVNNGPREMKIQRSSVVAELVPLQVVEEAEEKKEIRKELICRRVSEGSIEDRHRLDRETNNAACRSRFSLWWLNTMMSLHCTLASVALRRWFRWALRHWDAQPIAQPLRRAPFAARKEIARQLKEMQEAGVIQPSYSPWASPVVLVAKQDGLLRFCIDFHGLNAVTVADRFPLPRINDLLDQLGSARIYTTLDLASGYWQILMKEKAKEKTAFITREGLYEFNVMPFGLRNAPAVFQHLMQRVLAGLNPASGQQWVAVYLDDILIFSKNVEEHLQHLRTVFERLIAAGPKLKPKKCHFLREEVKYLGPILTAEGLKAKQKLLRAVDEFPVPTENQLLRRFLGLTSYYRRFICSYAKVAAPLHGLLRKDVPFVWTPQCDKAFQTLKRQLMSAPVLAFPDFSKDFVLETDACGVGLGAILSQAEDDHLLHPIAYGSRVLTPAERNYTVTELETLAFVWEIKHYRPYLYGHAVTVYTDHSAVKKILQTLSPDGRHARWWQKVYKSGITSVVVCYQPGRAKAYADCLSRSPIGDPEAMVSVAAVQSSNEIEELIQAAPRDSGLQDDFAQEQRKDDQLLKQTCFCHRCFYQDV